MIRKIVKGEEIFKKAEPAGKSDLSTATDLEDTLRANRDICVGLAANMIGVNKRIISVVAGPMVFTMLNPRLVKKFGGTYEVSEGCLSLDGERTATRFNDIEVEYFDTEFKKQRQKFSGYAAQVIQHEIDHCDGKII